MCAARPVPHPVEPSPTSAPSAGTSRHVYKTGADVLHAITAASAKDLQPKQLQQEESHVPQKHPPAEKVQQQQEGGGAAFGSPASQNKGRDAEGGGGLFREVLELSFPESIQPYFL